MKKIIILLLCFVSFGVKAQGNLQFNQVKLVTATETVPEGKVWKIESILYKALPKVVANIGNNNNEEDIFISINTTPVLARAVRADNSWPSERYLNYSVYEIKLPIWLPASSVLAKTNPIAYISVLEFNVIP